MSSSDKRCRVLHVEFQLTAYQDQDKGVCGEEPERTNCWSMAGTMIPR